MRILQLVANLDVGGLERLAVEMAKRQLRAGHETSICCMFHAGALARHAEHNGIRVRAFAKSPGFSVRFVLQLAQHLRSAGIQVLQTHNALVHHYGTLAARLAGVPVVVNTRHGSALADWNDRRERLYKSALRWTDRVILVSADLQREFVNVSKVPLDKTRVILNGIDFEAFSEHRARPGSHYPAVRFGSVGRLVPEKDHATLLRAFARVAAQLDFAELHILGDGPCRPAIEELAATLGISDRVHLHGFRSDVPQFLSKLDIFVLSSKTEGLPLVILEAMAAGLPIVSTRLSGVLEAAPENDVGWYCYPENSEALAAAMLSAALDPKLASAGETAHQLAGGFSSESTWRQYEALFRECLNRKMERRSLPVGAGV